MVQTRSRAVRAETQNNESAVRANSRAENAGTENPAVGISLPEVGPFSCENEQTGLNSNHQVGLGSQFNQYHDLTSQSRTTSHMRGHCGTEHPGHAFYTDPGLSNMAAHVRTQTPERQRLFDDDIAAHVPSPLKQQIARGDYVNLALLLKGAVELTELWSGGNVLALGRDGVLETRQKTCKDKITNVEKWTDAFLIYASIYLSTHVDKINELLHYMSVIREFAALEGGYAWLRYDEQFRIKQARSPSSWAKLNNDLWQRSILRKKEPENNNSTQKCFDYNKGSGNWPQCIYEHACLECSGPHPAVNCHLTQENNPQPHVNPYQVEYC